VLRAIGKVTMVGAVLTNFWPRDSRMEPFTLIVWLMLGWRFEEAQVPGLGRGECVERLLVIEGDRGQAKGRCLGADGTMIKSRWKLTPHICLCRVLAGARSRQRAHARASSTLTPDSERRLDRRLRRGGVGGQGSDAMG
jgi:hypothetical protein